MRYTKVTGAAYKRKPEMGGGATAVVLVKLTTTRRVASPTRMNQAPQLAAQADSGADDVSSTDAAVVAEAAYQAAQAESEAKMRVEVTAHTVTMQTSAGEQEMTIELKGFVAENYYATNLNLTGFTNWFASMNMCDFVAQHTAEWFGGARSQQRADGSYLSLLEMGSGLGRAGIMAAKAMEVEGCIGPCVLTDGEPQMVELLQQNADLNSKGGPSAGPAVQCQELWWGYNDQLEALKQQHPDGFDIIIGADLIYGKVSVDVIPKILETVGALLSRRVCGPDDGPPPALYLAFTRRELPIETLTDIADDFGLQWEMDEDFVFDVFDQNCDWESDFWRDAVFVFRRKPPPGSPPPPAAERGSAAAAAQARAAAQTQAQAVAAAAVAAEPAGAAE